MILRSIATQNFRNLADAETEFHPRANIFVGRNGQGKTNVLEAAYVLATTKSFRTNRIASVFHFDHTNLYVSGIVDRGGLERKLSVGLETGESKRRMLMINGEKVSLATYTEALTVFAYSSSRLDAIRGTPEERRRFLDRGVASINPGYLEHYTRYGRVLKQRNALLAEVGRHRHAAASLDAWDNELMVAGAAVHRARQTYLVELDTAFQEILKRNAYHVSGIDLDYRPNDTADLAERRRDEVRAGMTLVGPQRDVLEIRVDGRPAAEVLSGGEQKMIVLFLKFAKLELFRKRFEDSAVFLLDDVDAELDLEILQQLLQRLPLSTQVFATSAKDAFLAALEAGPHRRLTLEKGRVTAARDFA